MNETQVNIPLLRKAVEWAEAEAVKPFEVRRWYQGTWVSNPGEYGHLDREGKAGAKATGCGTCYCIAGYIGQLVDPRYEASDSVAGRHVSEVAAEALGVDYDIVSAADGLFGADNSISDVRRIAEDIAGERL